MDTLVHGGDITAAEKQFGIPAEPWLDLSTGISPWAWPVPDIPSRVWAELPYAQQTLTDAAAAYYGCTRDCVLPLPGSQAAIGRLPQQLERGRVALPQVGYREHERAWRAAGHQPAYYHSFAGLMDLVKRRRVEHVVVINPNNPTAETVSGSDILGLHRQLDGCGLCLVDEAFADLRPENSCAAACGRDGLLVLRSFGKFFGLAGLRLGFLLGRGPVADRLRTDLQPWGVSHPALWVGARALADTAWHRHQRQRIAAAADTLVTLLQRVFPGWPIHQAGLFATITGTRDPLLKTFKHCGRQGLLLRYDELPNHRAWLRFGLPGRQLARLEQTLERL